MAAGTSGMTLPTDTGTRGKAEETMSSWDYGEPDFEFDKEIEIDFDTNIDFDTDIELDVYKDVDVDVRVDTHVEGNSAFLTADVEAIGKDTFVEVDASVLAVEDTMSSVTLHAVAIVN